MHNPKHILIAEDELLISLVLRKHLEKIGFTVSLAKDKKSVFTALKEKMPNAIIMDYYLKDDNGVCLAKEIRKTENTIPIIFTTGGSYELISAETIVIPNSAVLIKPVMFADILNLLVSFRVID